MCKIKVAGVYSGVSRQGEATRIYGTISVIRIRFFIVSGNNFTD